MVAPFFVGMMIATYHDISWAFFLYGAAALVAGVVVLLLGVETKGKVLEEISP
jgi:branched-subunit amino acid transport protein AzlD